MNEDIVALHNELSAESRRLWEEFDDDDPLISARYRELFRRYETKVRDRQIAMGLMGAVVTQMAMRCGHPVHKEVSEEVFEAYLAHEPRIELGVHSVVSILVRSGYAEYALRLLDANPDYREVSDEDLRLAFDLRRAVVPRMMAAVEVGGEVLIEEVKRFVRFMGLGPNLKRELGELEPYKERIMEAAGRISEETALVVDAMIPPMSEELKARVKEGRSL